tara:strand:- start:1798 stop:2556 length:759 start_codon:yes stop_codon:yes gene_type:complete
MNYLIGDIGNTNIKICKIDNKFKIKNTYLFDSNSPNLKKEISRKLMNISKKNFNNNILFSSVVPKVYSKLKLILKKKKMKVHEIKNFNLKSIMKFNVTKYSQLGSDRIANSIGAYSKFKSNCIVVDFGTATTFDIVKSKGVYDGGVIAPGVKLSIENLYTSTALLPPFKFKKYPNKYGKNTMEALSSGFYWGYEGLINNILKKINNKNGINSNLILTGGYADFFKNRLIKKVKIEKNITILGIIEIYKKFLI